MKVLESFAAKADVFFPSSEEPGIGNGCDFASCVSSGYKLVENFRRSVLATLFFFLLSLFGCVELSE